MYEPWIGADYERTKLLLLGESCYSWQDSEGKLCHPSEQHSIEIVKEAIDNFAGATRFMKLLSRAIANEEWPEEVRLQAVWNRVAFTNYVGRSVGEGARTRPTAEMWREAAESFPELLERLRPRRVVVLGKDAWGHLPDTDMWMTDDVQGYRLADGSVALCQAVNHPSRGLSWRALAAVVQFACLEDLA